MNVDLLPLKTEGLVRSFGGLKATDGVSLEIAPGELHAVIGPNGAGKTTLVNLLTGELALDDGSIWIGGQNVSRASMQQRVALGLLRSFQITSVFDAFTVLENVCIAARRRLGLGWAIWRPLVAGREVRERALRALHDCGLTDVRDERAASLAYGQRRQLEIAMVLAAEPRILLFDEPMAGMSAAEGSATIELLRSLKGRYTILLIEHDMNAVFALADRISVLVYGQVIATGTAEQIRNHPDVRKAYLGDDDDA
jgi:branched-chain amino acid transport system ATP-binding protein